MELKGKTAIVTGASRGIGKEIALTLGRHGMNVVLAARSEAGLKIVQGELNEMGVKSLVVPTDIAEERDVNRLFTRAVGAFSQIDVVINNAGLGVFKPVEEINASEWDTVMRVNVRGTFLLTKAVIPYMKKRKQGVIINIASDVSKRTFANGSVYCASKYAQHAFAESVRKEVVQQGIKVSNIYPGTVDSSFADSEQGADYKKDWLQPSDIANAVVYVLQAPSHVVIDEIMLHPVVQEW
ncbi:MAG: SDR family oxidoreductase [Flammeovirgaceae bacterium]